MSTEFTTLSLLSYSLALIGIFASPTVRQRVPRVAVALLVLVPWTAALFAGALTNDDGYFEARVPLSIEVHDPPRSDDPIVFDANGTEYLRAEMYFTLDENEKFAAGVLPRATVRGELYQEGSRRLQYDVDFAAVYDVVPTLSAIFIGKQQCFTLFVHERRIHDIRIVARTDITESCILSSYCGGDPNNEKCEFNDVRCQTGEPVRDGWVVRCQ